MSLYQRSLLDVESLEPDSLRRLFDSATEFHQGRLPVLSTQPLVALLFFEPSTRTRVSFEMAALRLNCKTVRLDDLQSSSLTKGETLLDTLLNVIAMKPDAVVLRYGVDPDVTAYLARSPVPILMGGSGIKSHPTQALLDAYTIETELGEVANQRVLIVGDIAHSRVASSNLRLLAKMGAELAVCGPQAFLPRDLDPQVRVFADLSEGLSWASVVMALRIQLERMDPSLRLGSNEAYRAEYGLTEARLKDFTGIILHPGPVNQNVEMDANVLQDPRCLVLKQVSHGVAIRAALLAHCLREV